MKAFMLSHPRLSGWLLGLMIIFSSLLFLMKLDYFMVDCVVGLLVGIGLFLNWQWSNNHHH
ncbi:hypothetical protein ACFQ22_10425 [Lentilactobacillus raoultii]|uniref:Uncharacterized protein n=1 Tax=Lentilactobacillus raoultii TaxID=1987503 RepID=A0ABW3PF70_9LACO|nr:hypothetical protein [Lentilactobacillus raoultii]